MELRFGKDAAPPIIEFDTERKAGLADVMSAVDQGIPVNLQALYNQYKLPKPHDEDDTRWKLTHLTRFNSYFQQNTFKG